MLKKDVIGEVINMKNSLTSNKVLYFCMLIVIGLLSFMFFPYAFEINLVMVILGFFLICLEKEKLIANKKQAIPLGIALFIYLLVMGCSSYAQDVGINILRIAFLCLASFAAFFIGNYLSKENEYKVKLYDVIFSFLIFMTAISVFSTLYSYGLFYAYRYSSVASSAKMLVGFRIYEVQKDVLGYISALSLAPLSALIFYKGKKDHTFYILLASCLFGLINLLTSPNVVGLAIVICGTILTLLIRFFPKDKKKKIICFSALGIIVLLGIAFILLKGQQINRVRVIFDTLKNSIQYPLGMGYDEANTMLNGAMSTRNLFFDALYQGGWLAFISLITLWALIAILLYKYYKKSDDDSFKKNLILGLFIHYFIYVNLNYTQKIFVQYDDILPYYLDPMFLIILVFTGYMFQKTHPNSIESNSVMEEKEETEKIEA